MAQALFDFVRKRHTKVNDSHAVYNPKKNMIYMMLMGQLILCPVWDIYIVMRDRLTYTRVCPGRNKKYVGQSYIQCTIIFIRLLFK